MEKEIISIAKKNNIGNNGFNDTIISSDFYETVLASVAWFKHKVPTKTVTSYSPSSYRIKHLIEDYVGMYIPNGAAIAAAIICNFPIKKYQDKTNPNCGIGINKRSL